MSFTASLYTLGCRLNQADTALLADALRRAGFSLVPWGTAADLMVVNSCTVTGAAAQKTRQAVRGARRRNPAAFIVLAGCEVNAGSSDWEPLSVADLLVPNPEKMHLVDQLPARLLPFPVAKHAPLREDPLAEGFVLAGCGHYPRHTRANLKIQEGCDGFCSYCIVPYARGPSRSREWDDILREAEALVAAGHKEIVLTGVNIAKYAAGGRRLPDLARGLLQLGGGFRLRLSSTELCPELAPIIDLMATEKRLCKFLHVPIQHGDDGMLAAMNRPYTVARFAALATTAAALPGLCLGTDVIVGFPGETDEQFSQCLATIERLPIAYVHGFRFSPRPGTPAAGLPGRVHGRIVAERARRLAGLGKAKAFQFAASQVGRRVEVLTENLNVRGNREGWSGNYLRVELPGDGFPQNRFVQATIREVVDGRYVRANPCARLFSLL